MFKNVAILLLLIYSGITTFRLIQMSGLTLLKLEHRPKLKAPEWSDADFAELVINQ